MTDLCKAAEMALEALKETIALCINYKSVEDTDGYQFTEANDVIKQGESAHNALRQALAEPPKWVHLMTDEKADIRNSVDYSQFMSAEEYACKVQDATEAKLKELNHD